MTRFPNLRHLRVAGLALAAVAVAGAAVLITASASGLTLGFRPSSSNQPTSSGAPSVNQAAAASTVCNDFISHLSSDLGKSQSQVNAAVQKAIGETLADEVKNKQITQAQADKLKLKLAGQPPCNLAAGLSKAPAPAAKTQLGAYTTQILAAAAGALGVTPAQLQGDLAGGMTLSQVAAAKNITEAQFRTKLIAQVTPLLDAAVKANKLTAAQEQTILKRLKTGAIPFWSASVKHKPAAGAPAVSPTP